MKWIKTWDIFEGYLDEPEYKEISRDESSVSLEFS
jgi:hypothetical protein